MNRFPLVLSSPSGGGKSTIARQLMQARDDLAFSVSATTRHMRPGETDGTDYHFLTEEEFARRVADGDFLEHAHYGPHRYGTLAAEVDRIQALGKHPVLDIEIDGARQVRARVPEAVMVFVLPPSAEALAARLRGRDTETPAEVAVRLTRAQEELEAASEYDYVVVNDDLVQAVGQVASIIESESLKVARRADVEQLVANLQRGLTEAQSTLASQPSDKEKDQ
jgi:guanylate kinase